MLSILSSVSLGKSYDGCKLVSQKCAHRCNFTSNFWRVCGDLHILGGGAIVKEFLIFCLYQEDIQRNPVFKCHLSVTGFLSLSSKPRLPNTYHKQVSYVILFVQLPYNEQESRRGLSRHSYLTMAIWGLFQTGHQPSVKLLHLVDRPGPDHSIWGRCHCWSLPGGCAVYMVHVKDPSVAVNSSFPV